MHAAAQDGKAIVKYNDGSADGKQSPGGSGEMIEFNLPTKPAKVAGLRIHGSRYGSPQAPNESFLIYFLNEDRSRVSAVEMASYALFERGEEQWVTIAFDQPISVPQRFWIAVDLLVLRRAFT